MIHEEICTYELCKLAKEKGFDVPTFGYYRIDTEDWYRTDVYDDWNDSTIRYSAPTQSLLQRWLREEKDIHISINYQHGNNSQHHNIKTNSHRSTHLDVQSAKAPRRIIATQSHDTTCRAFVFEGGDYRGGCTVNITFNETTYNETQCNV